MVNQYIEIMDWECFGVIRFDLEPLLKLKSAYNSLIGGPKGLGW